jgi:hypothetical protein
MLNLPYSFIWWVSANKNRWPYGFHPCQYVRDRHRSHSHLAIYLSPFIQLNSNAAG